MKVFWFFASQCESANLFFSESEVENDKAKYLQVSCTFMYGPNRMTVYFPPLLGICAGI